MLDAKVTPYIKPMLRPLVSWLDKQNVTPNQITVAGFLSRSACNAVYYFGCMERSVCVHLLK